MNIKNFRYSFEALIIILGVIILINPMVINTVFNVLGLSIILYNVIKFLLGKSGRAFEYPMPNFISGILLGALVMIIPHMVGFGIPLVLGCFVLYNGIERLVQAWQIKQQGGKYLTPVVIGAVFTIVGVVVIINPFRTSAFLFRLLGLVLAGSGVLKIASDVKTRKQNEDIIPDIIEGKIHKD
ncbi:MAG: DUF308 domain-containing protein [Oscillospiraceae bacterium]|nr:DUF308 domain-containing protein [Oscillospiraceae bacterium]